MFAISDRSHVRQIVEAYAATQTKPPKSLSDALDRATRLAEAVQTMGAPDGALGVAVTNALDAGHDPAADSEVQRALAAFALAGNHHLSDQVTGAAVERVRGICQQEADNIIAGWSKAFDQAAAALTAAHERIGSVPLAATTTIVALGGDAAAVWAQAQTASKVIDTIAAGWQALGEFTRTVPNDPDYRVLRLASVDYETWTANNLRRAKLTPWEILTLGLVLALPTVAEYRQRVQGIEAGQATARQEAEAAAHDYMVGRRPAAERLQANQSR